jgi:hypothetical protein
MILTPNRSADHPYHFDIGSPPRVISTLSCLVILSFLKGVPCEGRFFRTSARRAAWEFYGFVRILEGAD